MQLYKLSSQTLTALGLGCEESTLLLLSEDKVGLSAGNNVVHFLQISSSRRHLVNVVEQTNKTLQLLLGSLKSLTIHNPSSSPTTTKAYLLRLTNVLYKFGQHP